MKINKKIKIGIIFLIGIFLISSFVSAAIRSSTQYTAPGAGSFSYLSSQGVGISPGLFWDDKNCNAGQDFIVQIAPFGCEPAVVRSDLLEEQNVPVFCQLAATKINPLIKVEAIDYLSFRGQYPKEVSGVGFHPARAAIKGNYKTLLNSPILNNIGYAVIVLKKQKNESAMPDFVEGTLTAKIRYDIKNAFGIGRAVYYLPELKDDDWDEKFDQYGFWQGKGYLKADGIDKDGATISIYADKDKKISSVDLNKGQTSRMIYLPGFYCMAGLQLKLDGLKNPTTRAKLDINGEIVEVAEGEKFLDNRCSVRDIEKKGIVEKIKIDCKEDDRRSRLELEISPSVELEICNENGGGCTIKDYELGAKLYKDDIKGGSNRNIFLGYIGKEKGETFIVPVMTNHKDKEDFLDSIDPIAVKQYIKLWKDIQKDESEESLVEKWMDVMNGGIATIGRMTNAIGRGSDFGTIIYVGKEKKTIIFPFAEISGAFDYSWDYWLKQNNWISVALNYWFGEEKKKMNEGEFYKKKQIKFIGFAGPRNKPFNELFDSEHLVEGDVSGKSGVITDIKAGVTVTKDVGFGLEDGTINIEKNSIIKGSVGEDLDGGIINIGENVKIDGKIGESMIDGTINIKSNKIKNIIGEYMAGGVINIESDVVTENEVGKYMAGGIINIKSGASVKRVGYGLDGGIINIGENVKIDGPIGANMVSGKIYVEKDVKMNQIFDIGIGMIGGTIYVEKGFDESKIDDTALSSGLVEIIVNCDLSKVRCEANSKCRWVASVFDKECCIRQGESRNCENGNHGIVTGNVVSVTGNAFDIDEVDSLGEIREGNTLEVKDGERYLKAGGSMEGGTIHIRDGGYVNNVGDSMDGGIINIDSGATVGSVGNYMTYGTIKIRSAIVERDVGSLMNGGIINIHSTAKINGNVGEGMTYGTINIEEDVIVEGEVGKGMTGGKIYIEEGFKGKINNEAKDKKFILELVDEIIEDDDEIERGLEVDSSKLSPATPRGSTLPEKITLQYLKGNYDDAMKDYKTIIDSFAGEKEDINSQKTFGEQALFNAIGLAKSTQQKGDLSKLCKEFEEKYPDSKRSASDSCNEVKLVNSEIAIRDVLIDARVKSISFKGIYEPTYDDYGAKISVSGAEPKYNKPYEVEKNERVYLSEDEWFELKEVNEEYVKIYTNTKRGKIGTVARGSEKRNHKIKLDDYVNIGQNNKYEIRIKQINLKKQARVSVIPNIKNAETEANFSFKIGIEKRAIQLSPDQIKSRLKSINDTIKKWESISKNLGKVVKGFQASCLSVGAYLTVKNFWANTGGKAGAREKVMRGDGGWYDICKDQINNQKGEKETMDQCLFRHKDDIKRDVDNRFKAMENSKITENNCGNVLSSFNYGDKIIDPRDKQDTIDTSEGSNIKTAFSKDDCKEKISLRQTRDLKIIKEELNLLNENDPKDKERIEALKIEEFLILKDIDKNLDDYALIEQSKKDAEAKGFGNLDFVAPKGEKQIEIPYGGYVLAEEKSIGNDVYSKNTPMQGIVHRNEKYYLILDEIPNSKDNLNIKKIYSDDLKIVDDVKLIKEIKDLYIFKKYDKASYTNPFKKGEAKVKYFETPPYKGLPAIIPFDTKNGWYVRVKQDLGVYDKSTRINSFELCNVGKNNKPEASTGYRDDICRTFSPGDGRIYGNFPQLTETETKEVVGCAIDAVKAAKEGYKSKISKVRIRTDCGGELNIEVGPPEIGIPNIQCQDLMSPDDCNLLFNVCDPVVCPSSRCNLGGTWPVSNVIQSGIFGSIALCLPNFGNPFNGGVAVPVCLTGVKAGVDGLVSVFHNYRDCLQTNLDTGETVGICDEIHSIYLCEFFWRQGIPLAKMGIPRLLEKMYGQGNQGGGEYAGVQNAWDNAEKTVEYMTSYYGSSSYEAFKSKVAEEIEASVCGSSISARYPTDVDFFDALMGPDSPSQHHAYFSEISYTTATVPPISQYKVFYHIYAGKDIGAYFQVYLKSPVGTSFYQDNPRLNVDSGYIAKNDYASETKDFTAPSGYKELCISVNGKDECGFKQVSSSMAVDFMKDKYMAEQGNQTDINSAKECISGSSSLYSLATPNIQEGVDEIINPNIRDRGIVRVCSTDSPGKATDNSRWQQVGNCDDPKMKCWLDKDSLRGVIQSTAIEGEVLKEVTKKTLDRLREEENYLEPKDFDEITKLDPEKNSNDIIAIIKKEIIEKAFLSNEKAQLYFLRGNAFKELTIRAYDEVKTKIREREKQKEEETEEEIEEEEEEFKKYKIDKVVFEQERDSSITTNEDEEDESIDGDWKAIINLAITHSCDKIDIEIKSKESLFNVDNVVFDYLMKDKEVNIEKFEYSGKEFTISEKKYNIFDAKNGKGSIIFEPGKSYYGEVKCYEASVDKPRDTEKIKEIKIEPTDLKASPREYCSDSDNGKDYFEEGFISGFNKVDKKYMFIDECNNNLLTEHYCEGTEFKKERNLCDYGCKNYEEACLKEGEKQVEYGISAIIFLDKNGDRIEGNTEFTIDEEFTLKVTHNCDAVKTKFKGNEFESKDKWAYKEQSTGEIYLPGGFYHKNELKTSISELNSNELGPYQVELNCVKAENEGFKEIGFPKIRQITIIEDKLEEAKGDTQIDIGFHKRGYPDYFIEGIEDPSAFDEIILKAEHNCKNIDYKILYRGNLEDSYTRKTLPIRERVNYNSLYIDSFELSTLGEGTWKAIASCTDPEEFEMSAEIIVSEEGIQIEEDTLSKNSVECNPSHDAYGDYYKRQQGLEIIKIIEENNLAVNIDDSKVEVQTGAKNFKCLILQQAMQESCLSHCIHDEDYKDNPLYCEDYSNDFEVLKQKIMNPDFGDEKSVGILQINLGQHNNPNGLNSKTPPYYAGIFKDNVEYAIKKVLLEWGYDASKKCDREEARWKNALGYYNKGGKVCEGEQNKDYIDEVIGRKNKIKELFPEYC
jgi:hypothetical protein